MTVLPAETRRKRQAETQRRAAICRECPHAVSVGSMKVFCGKCGCPLASKTRAVMATCPVGKW
ncbi:MAG TPA: hypothetical protein PKZ27_02775 [Rhodocyclaceae bacterium]|nr:hypothetical protein [Burkholderiaceae bacterium]HRP74489.1 hypothetical protein [Rhodocyclaceae bacterium]